jgi:hypothetical protein
LLAWWWVVSIYEKRNLPAPHDVESNEPFEKEKEERTT